MYIVTWVDQNGIPWSAGFGSIGDACDYMNELWDKGMTDVDWFNFHGQEWKD